MIEYERDTEMESAVREIASTLGMHHLDLSRVICMRSYGSKSRRVLARCHVMPRIMQKALGTGAYYLIEVVSENFEKLSDEDRTRTLIHELMHIPRSFGGGFRHHRPYVSRRNVEAMYREFNRRKQG
ncbi:MAG: metallopeptidase [Candidatus Aenigmarchaeota archaeon]|nr:metallopeptidase [Candidatus Aenigmarchaeota archaeon]